jgi:hypothetical protein
VIFVVVAYFLCYMGSIFSSVTMHYIRYQVNGKKCVLIRKCKEVGMNDAVQLGIFCQVAIMDHVRWVPLSPRHGASSGCGW